MDDMLSILGFEDDNAFLCFQTVKLITTCFSPRYRDLVRYLRIQVGDAKKLRNLRPLPNQPASSLRSVMLSFFPNLRVVHLTCPAQFHVPPSDPSDQNSRSRILCARDLQTDSCELTVERREALFVLLHLLYGLLNESWPPLYGRNCGRALPPSHPPSSLPLPPERRTQSAPQEQPVLRCTQKVDYIPRLYLLPAPRLHKPPYFHVSVWCDVDKVWGIRAPHVGEQKLRIKGLVEEANRAFLDRVVPEPVGDGHLTAGEVKMLWDDVISVIARTDANWE